MSDNNVRYYEMNGSDYYRARVNTVELWNGDEWIPSVLPTRLALLDDMLGGGSTVREITEEEFAALRGKG